MWRRNSMRKEGGVGEFEKVCIRARDGVHMRAIVGTHCIVKPMDCDQFYIPINSRGGSY